MRAKQRTYDRRYYASLPYLETEHSQRNQARLDLPAGRLAGAPPTAEGTPGPHRVLEVGCGQGGFLRVAQNPFEVEGIDISGNAIGKLRASFGERVRVANIEQQPLPSRRYAAIAAFIILEHLHFPERSVGRLFEALVPGGLLIGSVPNKQGAVGRPRTALTNLFDRTRFNLMFVCRRPGKAV